MSRLVIPADAQAGDVAWRGETWEQVAAANKVDGVEVLGSAWCVENGVDGLGIATERPVVVEESIPARDVTGLDPAVVSAVRELAKSLVLFLGAVDEAAGAAEVRP